MTNKNSVMTNENNEISLLTNENNETRFTSLLGLTLPHNIQLRSKWSYPVTIGVKWSHSNVCTFLQ